MSIYKITQIVYLGPGRRHEEVWYIEANRQPTGDEVRQVLNSDLAVLIQPARFDTWDLP